jgi:signal transduction histidine kinase
MKQGLLCLIHIGEDENLLLKAIALLEDLSTNVKTIFLKPEELINYNFNGVAPVILCSISNGIFDWQQKLNEIKSKFPHCIVGIFSEEITSIESFAIGSQFVLKPNDNLGSQYLWQIIASKQESYENQLLETQRLEKSLLEIQLKNKELEKINFELDRFVYSASHDLRSPLTSVLGLLYLLRNELIDSESIKYTNLMEESILKLDNTIRDIVTYSRNNRTEVINEKIKVKSVIKECVESLSYLTPAGTTLEESILFKGVEIINLDRNRLQTILNNLVSNSIRYRFASRPLKIEIKTEIDKDSLLLSVRDNGIGIKEQHLERIFDMFYRTNESSTGSGLGLYIVKETVNKLGGEINVSSIINEGTTFIISIPNSN